MQRQIPLIFFREYFQCPHPDSHFLGFTVYRDRRNIRQSEFAELTLPSVSVCTPKIASRWLNDKIHF